jgi:HK97 family phage major capsid protein
VLLSELMDEESEQPTYPLDYVRKLRTEAKNHRIEARAASSRVLEKGFLPREVNGYDTDLNVYINHFPLGDADNFHVSRAAYAKAQSSGRMSGRAWDIYAPWEKQYLDALSRVQYKAQGEYVSGQDGGFLAPELWNTQWFGLLRNFTVLDKLPITRVAVPYRVQHMPKVTGDVTVSYPGENNAPTSTQFNFGQVSYTAHKSMALDNVGNELIRDMPDAADQMLRRETAGAIATDRDAQLLTNAGITGAPTGILGMAGGIGVTTGTVAKYYPGASATAVIGTTPAHGIPSFLHVSGLRDKVHQLNGSALVTAGQAHCNGIVAHSRFETRIFTLTGASGPWTDAQGRPLWLQGLGGPQTAQPDKQSGDQNGLMGQVWSLTNMIPINSTDGGGTTSSFMIAGWWDQYVLFECLTPTYDSTPLGGTSSVGFGADETQIKVIYRYDGAPIHPEAFAVLAGCD